MIANPLRERTQRGGRLSTNIPFPCGSGVYVQMRRSTREGRYPQLCERTRRAECSILLPSCLPKVSNVPKTHAPKCLCSGTQLWARKHMWQKHEGTCSIRNGVKEHCVENAAFGAHLASLKRVTSESSCLDVKRRVTCATL